MVDLSGILHIFMLYTIGEEVPFSQSLSFLCHACVLVFVLLDEEIAQFSI